MNDETERVGEDSFIGDLDLIERTFQVARQGMGAGGSNPLVGAVIAEISPEGSYSLVAQGYHRGKGEPHAEVEALRALLDSDRLPDSEPERREFLAGCCMYINLEPCTHHGDTPPCTEAIIKSGIGRVCWACDDPNDNANGAAEELREAGVSVRGNLMPEQERHFNAPFHHRQESSEIFVALKLASSLDGKIATASGDSKWITSEQARGLGHTLRQRYDALLVGYNTVRADDPRLTVREDELNRHWRGNIPFTPRDPVVLIIDPQLQTPADARLFEAEREVLLLHLEQVDPEGHSYPEQAGFLELPQHEGSFLWSELKQKLRQRGIFSVLVEGGANTASELLLQDEAAKLYHFSAPLLIGEDGLSPYRIPGAKDMDGVTRLVYPQVEPLEREALLSGYFSFDPADGPESTAEQTQHSPTGMDFGPGHGH